MSKELYESLFKRDSIHEGTDELVATFAQMGRLRKAAYNLANDEMHEGTWAIETENDVAAARFAAEDGIASSAIYVGAAYRILLECVDGTWTVLQLDGPPGASLKLGEYWIVLQPGEPTVIPLHEWPDHLTLVDLSGLEIVLTR